MVKIKIFIDSSKIQEIKKAKEFGLLDGVTTNPSLIKAAVEGIKKGGGDVDIIQYIKDILRVAEGVPVSLEVIGTTYDEMVEEGIKLFKMFNPVARNVYIKIPINPATVESSNNEVEGRKAIKSLSDVES